MADFPKMMQSLRQSFGTGRTKPIEWRIQQLNGLLRMYEENETIFAEALHKDLRKPKFEAVLAEIENNKNDVRGALRWVRMFNIGILSSYVGTFKNEMSFTIWEYQIEHVFTLNID